MCIYIYVCVHVYVDIYIYVLESDVYIVYIFWLKAPALTKIRSLGNGPCPGSSCVCARW